MKIKHLIFIFSIFFFISCKQDNLGVSQVHAKLILEYKDNASLPHSRLSVFISSNFDTRKIDSLYIKDTSSDLFWETSNLFNFRSDDASYVGFSSFVVPDGELFSKGEYNLIVKAKDGQENTSVFNLQYDESYFSMNAKDAEEELKKSGAKESICIYNEEDKVIYFGNRSDELQTNRDIWLKYNDAKRYNSVWIFENKSFMFVMPFENVVAGEVNE